MIYGGKPRSLFPEISDKKCLQHSFDNWMIPNIRYHPFLPPAPSFPGLMLQLGVADDREHKTDGILRVVIQWGTNSFEYVGQYELMQLGQIYTEEWKAQPVMVFWFLCVDFIWMTEQFLQGEKTMVEGHGGWSIVEGNRCSCLPQEAIMDRSFCSYDQ